MMKKPERKENLESIFLIVKDYFDSVLIQELKEDQFVEEVNNGEFNDVKVKDCINNEDTKYWPTNSIKGKVIELNKETKTVYSINS